MMILLPKHVSWVLFTLFMVVMTSCNTDSINNSPPVSIEKPPIVMGFAQVGDEGGWRAANTKSIQESAEEYGVRLIWIDAKQSQEAQIQALRSFFVQEVDVIAFSPVVESGWDAVLTEAKTAGIPVILTDRAIDSQDTSLYITFLGSDFLEEGRKAGKWLLDKINNDTDELIRIAELQGTVGSAPTIDRKKGFEEIIQADSNMKIVYSKSGEFTRERGKVVMSEFLKQAVADKVQIDVVYSHNDDMTLGAIEAIEEAGLLPGVDIILISFDGIREAFETMAEGKINLIVECNPILGPQLMQATQDLMSGKTLPKRMVVREGVFTQDRAREELPSRKY